MLVIRMQRTGRSGHAQFRVVVQDSRRTPTSGNIVANLGHFNPHTKETVLNKEKAGFYLEHGAQPSERVARLLKAQGVKLPAWVKLEPAAKAAIRNPEKLRRNRPPEAKEPTPAASEEKPADEPKEEALNANEATEAEPTEVAATEETKEEAVTDEAAPKEPAEANEKPDSEAESK